MKALSRMICVATLTLAALHAPALARSEAPAPPAIYNKEIKITPLVVSSTTADGSPIVYPKTENPEVRILIVEIPPKTQTGWHVHPMPCYGYVIEGTVTVELEDGTKHEYKAGDGLIEYVNTLHNGTNTGDTPTRILMVVTSEKGVPVSKLAEGSKLREIVEARKKAQDQKKEEAEAKKP